MTENKKKKNNNQIILSGSTPLLIKEKIIIKDVAILRNNNINIKNTKKEISLNDNLKKAFNNSKDIPQSLKNSINFSKAQTKSREIDKRYDIFGNLIERGGNHHISFIDRVSKNNFAEVIKIDNYKEYNKMEEIAPTNGNGCCVII